jgi:phosphatidylserine decarboxylase
MRKSWHVYTVPIVMIAKEGLPYIVFTLACAAVISLRFELVQSLPFWLLMLFFIYLFRDPDRAIPASPLALISPADGKIEKIERVQDPLLERDAIRITINMSHLGSYTARSPVEGKIMERWFIGRRGKADALETMKLDGCEEIRFAQWIRTDEDDDVILCMSGGVPIHRPSCYVQSGERVGQGQRCGYIPFGARLDLMIPANARVEVKQGQHIHAGSDVLAHLVHG